MNYLLVLVEAEVMLADGWRSSELLLAGASVVVEEVIVVGLDNAVLGYGGLGWCGFRSAP